MLFSELSTEEQIEQVKKHFTALIEEMIADKTVISKYLNIVEPTFTVAKCTPLTDQMSEEEKKETDDNNKKLVEQISKINSATQKAYEDKLKDREKIVNILAGLKPLEHCICIPTCIDVSSCLNAVMPEMEIVLDKAREIAATKNY